MKQIETLVFDYGGVIVNIYDVAYGLARTN